MQLLKCWLLVILATRSTGGLISAPRLARTERGCGGRVYLRGPAGEVELRGSVDKVKVEVTRVVVEGCWCWSLHTGKMGQGGSQVCAPALATSSCPCSYSFSCLYSYFSCRW